MILQKIIKFQINLPQTKFKFKKIWKSTFIYYQNLSKKYIKKLASLNLSKKNLAQFKFFHVQNSVLKI